MFRELTYEELGFVSGGKPDQPPQEPPPPQVDIEVQGDAIYVTASAGAGNDGVVFVTGAVEFASWNLSEIVAGYTDGTDTLTYSWDFGEADPADEGFYTTYTHVFDNGVSVSATISDTVGNGDMASVRFSWTF